MAKFDEQLSRMQYLMGYKMPVKESRTGVDYSVVAADGRRYGIIKEGTKYYVKVSDASKENLAESYDYINGITAKKENEFKSYNEATKHLELKLMSLNEAYNGSVKASTLDPKRSEKVFATLTEEARKELNRMHTIFEAANTIGMNNTGNPEAPKTAKFTPSIGKPFEEKAEATLDKDFKKTASNPKAQTEPCEKEVKVTDADMESDENKKCNGSCACNDFEDAKYVPDNSVANKKPSGGKVVRVNEATVCEDDDNILGTEDETVEGENILTDENLESEFGDNDDYIDGYDEDGQPILNGGIFLRNNHEPFTGELPGDFSIEDFDRDVDLSFGVRKESKNSLKRIVESVCDNIVMENKKQLAEERLVNIINRLVKEEVTNLNVWGQHPGYRKQAFKMNSVGADKNSWGEDWNDDSVYSEKPFGSQIGDGAPYSEDVVNDITDVVVKTVKSVLKKK